MAKKMAYEPCMLCMQLPCACFGAPKPRKQARRAAPLPAKSTASAEGNTGKDELVDITSVIGATPSAALSSGDGPAPPAQKQGVHAAMRARVAQAPAPTPVTEPASDPVMDDAIRSLAPLLHPIELRQYQAVLEAPRTIVRRAEQWRGKRRGS